MMKKLRLFQALLTVLLLISLAIPALAHERVGSVYYFGGDYQDTIYEPTVLPNGCLLLNGYRQQAPSNELYRETRAWLLCLKPGGEVAWEYLDDARGTTRYVLPIVQADGRITVLFYNSPSQVTEEVAIHSFSQDGELLSKTPLPRELELTCGRMADGYLFGNTSDGYVLANESGVSKLATGGEGSVNFNGGPSVLPTEDGCISLSFLHSKNADSRISVIVRMDAQGHELWRFSSDEFAKGSFRRGILLENGDLLCLWDDVAAERRCLLRLNASGELVWQRDVPWDLGSNMTPCEEGFVFVSTWQKKTFTHIRFTLINEQGEVTEIRESEPLKDDAYGCRAFSWQGEVWYTGGHTRNEKRVNDRQDSLELEDVALVRMKDCPLVEEE